MVKKKKTSLLSVSKAVVVVLTGCKVHALFFGAQETCQSSSSSLYQERRLISVNVGDSVTLQCLYQKDDDDDASLIFWYKQPLGKQPKIISTYHKYKKEGMFHDEFMNYTRLTLNMRNNTLYLKISDVKASDSATYYCLKYSYQFKMQFSEGTTVVVKDANSSFNALVQQSDSKTTHPGDSVTLNCTASTGSSDGEPSVYWFKNSEDHHPSLIYTQSDNSDQCERKTNKTHTCVYNLSLNNLDQSNAGTYYCAVTVCGRIVFGNGTRLELKGKKCCNMSNCLMIGYIKNTFIVKLLGEATVKGIVYARKILNHSWIYGFYCCG
uniref:Ig-like domain-containing protein n=1 Tax=Gouania willdenowi TaxID=441366 RepID=A0A8C5HJ10_GOUWI